MARVELYDTTLRDGAQMEGISYSVEDKLCIARKLDELGVHSIEGGWPGSNSKDAEFFHQARSLPLKRARLAAFGSTRRAGTPPERDPNLRALLDAGTPVVTLVGKAWDLHVRRVLETSLEENLKRRGRTVFFDAEHFFDGFKAHRDYALACLRRAQEAGADCVVLCDTNGECLPHEVYKIVSAATSAVEVPLGIHAHNDTECAVANSLAAVRAGAVQVQGTVNGYGERCGNANLLSFIADLQLKMGIPCVPEEGLRRLTEVAHFVAEAANRPLNPHQPYVGASAFAHKAGLHASAVLKVEESYQHVPPEAVGNARRVLVSELAGRGNIRHKLEELGLADALTPEQVRRLAEAVKEQEAQGYRYEGAEASFELLVRRVVNQGTGTAARVRVLVESSDGEATWRTVGASANIIEASWLALADALEWWLLRRQGR